MASRNRDVNIGINAKDGASDKFAAAAKAFETFEQRLQAASKTLSDLSKQASQSGDSAFGALKTKLDAASKALDSLASSSNQTKKTISDAGQASQRAGDDIENSFSRAGNKMGVIQQALQKMSGIPIIGQGIGQLASAFGSAGSAASAAGTAASVSWAPVVLVIGAIVAAVAVLVGAFAAAGASIQQASAWANTVDDIQDVTGASAEMASTFAVAGQAVGVSGDQMAQSLGALARNEYQASQAAEEFGVKASGAYDKASKQFQQLSEDYDRSITEATQSATERIEELHKEASRRADEFRADQAQRQSDFDAQMADSARTLNERLGEMGRTYREQEAENARQLSERLGELAQQHTDRVAELQQSLADAQSDFDDQRQAREERLADQLAGVSEDFESKRDAVRKKYWAPKSERERQAMKEELEALDGQEAAERKKLEDKAKREEAKAQKEQDKKIARLQAQLAKENAEYERQTAKLKAEEDRRAAASKARFERETQEAQVAHDRQEQSARKRFERENQSAQQAYDRQVQSAAEAEAKIAVDRDKQLANLERQYQRAAASIQESITTAGSAAGGAGKAAVDPFIRALDELGIAFEDYQALSPDQKLELLAQKFAALPDGARKTALEMAVFGKSGRELNDLLNVISADGIQKWQDQARSMGLLMDEAGVQKMKALQLEQSRLNMAFQGLGNTIGQALAPVLTTLLSIFNNFWEKHGPAVLDIIRKIGAWLEENLPKAIQATSDFWNNTLKPALQAVWAFIQDKVLPIFRTVWAFLNEKVFPIFKTIGNFLEKAFKVALGVVILAFDSLFKALTPVWQELQKVWQQVEEFLKPALQWFSDNVLKPLGTAFDDVARTVGNFFGGLQREFDRLLASFPDWLKKLLGIQTASFTPTITYAEPPARASGGSVMAGTPYLVGERGPEMVTFGRAGYVHDSESTKRALQPPSQQGPGIYIGTLIIQANTEQGGRAAARGLINQARSMGVSLAGAT